MVSSTWPKQSALLLALVAGLVLLASEEVQGARIKDIARFDDEQQLSLIGTGLVTGLAGTGDGNGFRASIEGLVRNLERLGITIDSRGLRAKNVAMVQITATLRSSARPGTTFDISVSSIGDANSLQGGVLLPASLVGVTDGTVYATASGPISIGGFNVDGGANNRVSNNHATVGRVSDGAQIIRQLPSGVESSTELGLLLNHADRTTAVNVARTVNALFPGAALAEDAGYVRLQMPTEYLDNPMTFCALIEDLETEIDARAKVVVNERTGTIVVGGGVQLREAAIAHGSLTIEIRTRYDVSQPNSFNESGSTVVTPDVQTWIEDDEAHVLRLPATTTVQDVVDVLNGMGATPRDIIAMLQALKAAGSLQAELEVL